MPAPFSPQDIVSLVIDLEKGEAPAPIVSNFKRIITEYAFQNARSDPDERLMPSSDHPGYLVTVSGEWKIFVPWPLAFSFPGQAILDGLVAVAERAMLEGPGNVALSGSTNFSGRIAALGDIDLVQYIFPAVDTFSERVRKLTQRICPAILLRAKFRAEYTAPWEKFLETLEKDFDNKIVSERLKLDFMDGATPFGLMPVSNIVLASDPANHTRGAARKSFVFQEAVLVDSDNPPWPLMMVEEVLRYLKFLTGDARKYSDADNAIKALKRGLSLARFLGLEPLAQRAEAVLSNESSIAASKNNSIEDLEKLWPYLTDKQKAELHDSLVKKKEIAAKIPLTSASAGDPKFIVGEILSRMDQLLAREGRSINDWVESDK